MVVKYIVTKDETIIMTLNGCYVQSYKGWDYNNDLKWLLCRVTKDETIITTLNDCYVQSYKGWDYNNDLKWLLSTKIQRMRL